MARQKVVGECRLCLKKQVELQDSHIIPEFFYKKIYDEKGCFQVFTDAGGHPGRPGQKGFRERLLCWECEQKLSGWEKYAKELLFDQAPQGINHGDRMVYSGVDYARFKLFQMSLIWRMSVTSHRYFRNVSCGAPHEERMRQMLVAADPGDAIDYGCWLSAVSNRISEFGGVVMPPIRTRKKPYGHSCYVTVLGGCFWIFFVSSHMEQFPAPEIFLQVNDSLPIWKEGGKASQFLDHWVDRVKQANAEYLAGLRQSESA